MLSSLQEFEVANAHVASAHKPFSIAASYAMVDGPVLALELLRTCAIQNLLKWAANPNRCNLLRVATGNLEHMKVSLAWHHHRFETKTFQERGCEHSLVVTVP